MNRNDTAVFLDIDGVLQPLSSQKRFDHDLEELRKELAEEFNNEDYLEMDRYDLGAVKYDWDKEAVERLKTLCDRTGAKIVISSAWREFNPLNILKWYFKIHDLDRYIIGETPFAKELGRAADIKEYLDGNPDIKHFVILDDAYISNFEKNFPDHFVWCRNDLDDEALEKALDILKKQQEKN